MASLALLQGYSSAEEDEQGKLLNNLSSFSSSDDDISSDDDDKTSRSRRRNSNSYRPPPNPTHNPSSTLPSVEDAFSEIAGPPEFLNHAVGHGEKPEEGNEVYFRRRRRDKRKDKRDLPAGVVMEAKAQLVGIRDRVRSDEGSSPAPAPADATGERKRIVTATNPEAKDAADLLRMCLQCGVPKTYSHARGMVCPICGDRPPADPLNESDKKKGSTIKDKEKSKRMKGQSSHGTWKSETEMQLRQQFD